MGKVLLPCPWLDLTWNVREPTILAMVRLRSIGFLLQVGRCYIEDHGAWQERLSTHVCWSTFVSERCGSRDSYDLHFTWIYYMYYIIGRSATRSKLGLQLFLSTNPLFFPPTCPSPLLYGSHSIIFLRTKVFFVPSYRDSLVCNSCASLARRSQQHYKQTRRSRSGYHSMHGIRHRCSYRWRCASIIFGLPNIYW